MKEMKIGDRIQLPCHYDVINALLGKSLTLCRTATYPINDTDALWLIHIADDASNNNKGWHNTWENIEHTVIREEFNSDKVRPNAGPLRRVVFQIDEEGIERAYVFRGVYLCSDPNANPRYFQRVETLYSF